MERMVCLLSQNYQQKTEELESLVFFYVIPTLLTSSIRPSGILWASDLRLCPRKIGSARLCCRLPNACNLANTSFWPISYAQSWKNNPWSGNNKVHMYTRRQERMGKCHCHQKQFKYAFMKYFGIIEFIP